MISSLNTEPFNTSESDSIRLRVLSLFETSNVSNLSERSMESSIDSAIHQFLQETEISSSTNLEALVDRFLDTTIPFDPDESHDYLESLIQKSIDHSIHVSSPQFIGHMTAALPYFVRPLTKFMVAMNQNVVKAETSKIFTPYERQVLGKLHRLIYNFSDQFYRDHIQNSKSTLGFITSGGTIANITALWCARNAILAPKDDFSGVAESGLVAALKRYGYDDAVIIGSQLMHYSFDKAADILGIGNSNLIKLPANHKNQVDLVALEDAVARCQAENKLIIAIVGVAGTTDSGGIDPLAKIAAIAKSVQAHFHVDAAWGGPVIFSRQHRHKLAGIELADSVTIDGHKQLYLPMGTGMLFLRNPALAQGIEKQAPYTVRKGSVDLGRRSLEGSRANTALLVHAGLHLIGIQGYEFLIDEGIRKVQYLAQKIKSSDEFELLAEPDINLLIYRFIPPDLREQAKQGKLSQTENQAINQINQQLQTIQHQTGRTFVSRTTTRTTQYGQGTPIIALRVVLANPLTTEASIDAVLQDQLNLVDTIIMNFPRHRSLSPELSSANLSPAKKALLEKWKKKTIAVQQIPKCHDRSQIPLSFPQKRIWFIDRFYNGSPFYNLPGALHIKGKLNIAVLQQSLNQILQRHEAWRTVFVVENSQPIQQILSHVDWKISIVSSPDLLTDWQSKLDRLAQIETQKAFDLTQAPLVRATLLQVGEEEHILLLIIHHIIADGWSIGLFMHELITLYDALIKNNPISLPELSIQYADFAVWQQERIADRHLDSQLAYWKRQLSGELPVLELPTDRPRSTTPTFQGARYCFTLKPDLTQSLSQLSQQQNATLFMVLFAAFNVLLHRYSDQNDILIGSAIANRNQPELERLLGCFVNLLVLRTDLNSDPTFQELLQRVREVTLDAYTYQDLPFEKLVEELQPDRDLGRHPLFQIMFVLQNSPTPADSTSDLTWNLLEMDGGTAMFDLFLSMIETKQVQDSTFGSLKGVLEYNTDLFDRETIERFMTHFQNLLEGIVASPEQRISQLPLLSNDEQFQILNTWNQTSVAYPGNLLLHQWFEQQVERSPQSLALVEANSPTENQQLTYQQINQKANQLACYLQTLGIVPETLIGVCLERSIDLVTTILAILKIGGVYVPLDPSYPNDRLAFMLKDCQAPVLITQTIFTDQFANNNSRNNFKNYSQVICLDQQAEMIGQNSTENLNISIPNPDPIAYVIYTSGSTGIPKGVLGTHRGTVSGLHWLNRTYRFEPGEVCCQKTAISFVDSIWEIFGPLLHGIPTIIFPDSLSHNPQQFLQMLTQYAVSRILVVPSLLQIFLETYPDLVLQLTSLKLCITSGEAISPVLVRQFHQALPHVQLINLYGSSEVSANVTYYDTTALPETANRVPIGRPLDNTQVYLLDRHLQPVPIGVAGELYISGVGLAQGYLNQPELTNEKFVPVPMLDGTSLEGHDRLHKHLYKTGDLARYLPDGNLEYLGRHDDQIKIRGMRVELGEIRSVLLQHADVDNAVVVIRLDCDDSEGDVKVVAYVVTYRSNLVPQLRSYLRSKLPSHMVPAAIVELESIPLLPNGKVDKRSLPELVPISQSSHKFFTPPRSSLELALTQIWKDLLGLKAIDVTHSFFELGGHSLLAIRLLAQINQQFGQSLPLSVLFERGTIAQLAETLQKETTVSSQIVPIGQNQGISNRPILFCIHPAGGNIVAYPKLAEYLGVDQPFYALEQMPTETELDPISVSEMAFRYITEIRQVQPTGPYNLAGWCYGGVVAFEMASQLQQQGQAVNFLGVMDAILHKPNPQSVEEEDAQFLLRIAESAKTLFGIMFDLTYEELRQLSPDEQFKLMMRKGNIENPIEIDYYLRSYKLFKIHVQAMREYIPKPLKLNSCPMVLFRAVESIPHEFQNPEFTTDDSFLGWRDYLSESEQQIQLVQVPGNHFSMFTEPHVQKLAQSLKSYLEL